MATSVVSSTGSELGLPCPTTASSAVDKQLKTLCLHEFPCGLGSWREPKQNNLKSARSGRAKIKPLHPNGKSDSKVLVQFEKSESLQELVSSTFSPWHLDYSWSDEAKELREVAVKSPWLIDQNFVLNYFKTLRIVDKNVAEVDEDLLMLRNLEELTLSANFITTVNSKCLPPSLKVLELCANQISDISALCVRPPLLSHLGLGYNRISFTGDYITGDYWPNLLSLDLCHNDLCDLMDIVRKLITLPNLRNLVLQGCPLCLIPSYRGYTIDSLRRLSVMDDIHISADEKHHFKGLARRREFIVDEAKVQLGVSYIKGLPCPEEIKFPENQPEFPIVERRYFIQFMFPEDHIVHMANTADSADPMALELEMEAAAATVAEHQEDHSEHAAPPVAISVDSPLLTDRKVEINSKPDVQSLAPTTCSQNSFPRANPNTEQQQGSVSEGMNLDLVEESVAGEMEVEDACKYQREEKLEPLIKLAPVNSDPQPWSEEIELNWTTDLTRDDLLTLRNFFKLGMEFNVVESVVLGYPGEPSEPVAEKSESKDKKKPEQPPPKGKGSGKKKAKKEPEIELIKSPPTYTNIATFHVTLDHFLEGEFEYQNIFTKGDVPPPSTIRSVEPDDRRSMSVNPARVSPDDLKKSPDSLILEKRDSKDKKKLEKATDKKKDKNENAKKGPRGPDKKAAGKGKHEEGEEDDGPPPPLELEVTVKLHHWTTAMDSVREEEERTKALMASNKSIEIKEQLSTARKDMESKEHLTSRKGSNK